MELVQDRNHFASNANKKPRLRGVGISTRLAMINMKLYITDKAAKEIDRNIILSHNRTEKKDVELIFQQTKPTEYQKFKDNGRVCWAESIPKTKFQIFRTTQRK